MSTIIAINDKIGFYERILLGLFSEMQLGSLELILPSGQELKFGNGENSICARIEIKNSNFFKRCVLYGDIGFGESYVDGDWETPNIQNVIKWFLLNIENTPGISGSLHNNFFINVLKFFNKIYHSKKTNSIGGSKKNISEHYDLNNTFFSLFLDPTMTYSSAYFKEENMTLEEAQLAKYDRLCRQLNLKPSDHVLEIGSGWGGNAIYIAKTYGCKVTSLTISEEQHKLANERIIKENLSDKVSVILKDYRLMEGKFDKLVSIEMLEAVGAEFYNEYFKKCSDLLKKDGIFAIQVITCPDSRFEHLKNGVDWIQKHIFPGSLLPSVTAINKAINEVCDLTLVDLKDLGLDYAHTLKIWQQEFSKNIEEIKKLGFDDYFIRKWNYYFSYCEAAFAMRNIHVMQLVYTRPNNVGR
ncbi:cyclopropane-fatty-acyl-phospholipid synthase family protein [Aurantibacillus circumpalustris]|uniref:cyclopropane-fatty-acyl-phospholipid synthase family protein n=1 Tax=Aurantibacillus circumpalustris TaxID=3036359 RepID=UPI00295C3229|nr:cyclopropane-fatty-acyl-phospholipid synthase family protein [Aurantibacillus circumpalustris]